MENYVRVKPERQQGKTEENEIRINAQGKPRAYITYATTLLTEKEFKSVVIKATGQAINKAVGIAEIVKRRIPGLHQNTELASTEITDVWEPKEGIDENLDTIETTRRVSMITITLSKDELDTKSIGYQAPLPEDEIKPLDDGLDDDGEDHAPRRPRQRGRGRGGNRNRGGGQRGGGGEGGGEGDGAPAANGEGNRASRGRRRRGRPGGKAAADTAGGDSSATPAAAGGEE